MATIPPSSPACVVIDASFLIAVTAKEPGRQARAQSQLTASGAAGSQLFAPGALIAECLFALCKNLEAGLLTTAEHEQAVLSLAMFVATIAPPPGGESPLILRAEQIRAGYGCSRSSDGLYLALAESLSTLGSVELVTFDAGMRNQAAAAGLTITVRVLTP